MNFGKIAPFCPNKPISNIMKRAEILSIILGEINESNQKSNAKYTDYMSEEDINKLANKITGGVVYLLISQSENVESLFNGDESSSDQPEVVVIDDLMEEHNEN